MIWIITWALHPFITHVTVSLLLDIVQREVRSTLRTARIFRVIVCRCPMIQRKTKSFSRLYRRRCRRINSSLRLYVVLRSVQAIRFIFLPFLNPKAMTVTWTLHQTPFERLSILFAIVNGLSQRCKCCSKDSPDLVPSGKRSERTFLGLLITVASNSRINIAT